MNKQISDFARELVVHGTLFYRRTPVAWREQWHDVLNGPGEDAGAQAAIDAGLAWLADGQDHSATRDGGVPRHYSLISQWANSYPETTGYSIPTWLEHARRRNDAQMAARARRALDWLVSIQFPSGAFQGSTIGVTPVVPVTFDTGQILLGLIAGSTTFGEPYTTALGKAADWLAETISAEGTWQEENRYLDTHQNAPRTFETHAAWALLEAARLRPDKPWAAAGLSNIRWAVRQQLPNGWFPSCCLIHPERPLTHTLAYAMRGVLEGYRFSRDPALLDSALLTARALANAMTSDGFLAGTFDCHWRPRSKWSCLTGTVQSAICWLLLFQETGDRFFLDAALRANRYVRRTLHLRGPAGIHGGVKGSFPVGGAYNPFLYLNCAVKFMIDANTLELDVRSRA